ncbi:hypothetical protein [Gorillibacterium sp. CAU 1737]|uniref:hypothetical protein n=1 Tax=Gorillibacterium sp. CAU 1737 TaxID=3140362 RepID=UPI0032612F02
MSAKIAILIPPPRVTRYRYERLRHCSRCGSFTSLREEVCSACGRKGTLQPLERIGAFRAKGKVGLEALLLVLAAVAAVYLAPNATERTVAAVLGAALLTGYGFLLRRYAASQAPYRLHRVLLDRSEAIGEGLAADERAAETDYEADHYLACYEKLREIGVFLLDDRIRYNKLICLDRFMLRKDMELELETVVPRKYNKLFVRYLWEVSKIDRSLIREKSIDYVLRYRGEIEKMNLGPELLTNIASAALKFRGNLGACEYLISDYAASLPRERFIRLCRLVAESGSDYPELALRVERIADSRYPHDSGVQAALWIRGAVRPHA